MRWMSKLFRRIIRSPEAIGPQAVTYIHHPTRLRQFEDITFECRVGAPNETVWFWLVGSFCGR